MDVSFESFPKTEAADPLAYKAAMETMKKGDFVFIFTPDDTHFDICKEAISRGLHVLVTKPAVKTLKEHLELVRPLFIVSTKYLLMRIIIKVELARTNKVLITIEVHKRWDPIYSDACQRIRGLGDFSYFNAYMSQPKKQLITFKSWAGKSSDISYYLNSHHVDFHVWSMKGHGAVPTCVT
jgi:D-galacturonate reductase